MEYQLFLRYTKFADNYKIAQPNIYFFLKDCGFQRIYKAYGNRFPNPECQNMCNSFQAEMQHAQWQRKKMSKDEYHNFLEGFFKKTDFNTVDLETLELLKLITENVGIFGSFDDLTSKRIIYFNKKIETLKKNPPKNVGHKTNNYNYDKYTPQNTVPQNTVPQNTTPNTKNMGLPDPGKGDLKSKDAKKAAQAAEDARLNEIMRQQKLNSPIYITNVQPGTFYNPYTNPQYIPPGVNKSIPLPMNKSDHNYPKLKAIIEEELILANQELDYHKIDMARGHLERAAYYLKNVID
jgi:uncharacterized protein YihD (DUF1040 family)